MIDVRESPELQAAIIGLRRMRSDLRPALYKEARAQVGGLWLPALRARATTLLEQKVMLAGARVKTSSTGFSVLAANSNKKLRGGLIPSINTNWAGAEFGAKNKTVTYRRRSVLGRMHSVTRTVGAQWRSRVKDGRIAFDAASEIGTKLVAVWVVTVVTQIRDAARGKVV
jgi:hypothetical protein